MAIVTTKHRVCDVCGEDEGGVQRVRITILDNGSGSTTTVDLCKKLHLPPVMEAVNAKPKGPRRRRAVTPKSRLDGKGAD